MHTYMHTCRCANSALVIARMRGASADLLATLATSLSLNKLAGFLLLLVAGLVKLGLNRLKALLAIKSIFSIIMLVGSCVGSAWLVLSAMCIPAWRRRRGRRLLVCHFVLQLVFSTSGQNVSDLWLKPSGC